MLFPLPLLKEYGDCHDSYSDDHYVSIELLSLHGQFFDDYRKYSPEVLTLFNSSALFHENLQFPGQITHIKTGGFVQ